MIIAAYVMLLCIVGVGFFIYGSSNYHHLAAGSTFSASKTAVFLFLFVKPHLDTTSISVHWYKARASPLLLLRYITLYTYQLCSKYCLPCMNFSFQGS